MQASVFSLIGGLGIFLLGINQLTEGLKRSSSHSIKNFLKKITGSPLAATLIGVVVTVLLQSSSATTVLTVGFVNAGMMTLKQAIGVVFGANVGTTVTAQLMAFKVSKFAALFITGGLLLFLFGKRDWVKNVGSFVLGFGLIFFGMTMMSDGVRPLRSSPEVMEIFANLSHHPFLGVLAGLAVTLVIQSSSATVGIVLTLIGSGILDVQGAIPIILGDNIGTCVTAGLAAIGGNLSARRTAVAHFGFNIIGTIIVVILLPLYIRLIMLTSDDPVRQAANAHTLFNIFNTLLFLPFTGLYTKLIERIIPGKVEIKEDRAIHLAKNLLQSPPIALEAVDKEIGRALAFCSENLDITAEIIQDDNFQRLDILKENENITDNLQIDITTFLVELSQQPLLEDDATVIPRRLHSINDVERIGDHGENLGKILKRKRKLKINFPKEQNQDLLKMIRTVHEYLNFVVRIIEKHDYSSLKTAMEFESEIDQMKKSYKKKYTRSLKKTPDDGMNSMVYYDLIVNLERIGDHLTNIAEAYTLPAKSFVPQV